MLETILIASTIAVTSFFLGQSIPPSSNEPAKIEIRTINEEPKTSEVK